MKRILLFLFCSLVTLNADVVLTKKLQDGDIGQDQYQLFVTNTKKVSLKGLTPKVVYQGNVYKRLDSNSKIKGKYPSDVKVAIDNVRELDEFDNWFPEINMYFSLTSYLTSIHFDFSRYFSMEDVLKTTEYYDSNSNLIFTSYKLLQGQDGLGFLFSSEDLIDDYDDIFASSNDTSYGYYDGKTSIMFLKKSTYDKELVKRKKEDKGFTNEAY